MAVADDTSLDALIDRVPAAGAAYVDRDWLTGTQPPSVSCAIVYDPGIGLRWPSGLVWPTNGEEPDAVAWRMLDALAAAASVAVGDRTPTLVAGAGLLAERIRARLTRLAGEDETPASVVETTGRSSGLAAACSAVADLGTVALVAAPQDGALAYDLYVDVHRRGLRVVGVPDPPPSADSGRDGAPSDAPTPLTPTQAVVGDASSWFVVRGQPR